MSLKKESALFLTVRSYFLMLLFFASILACRNNELPVPAGLLTPAEMLPIVVDIHLVEGARSGNLVLGDTNNLPDYYAKIYQKHNVTEAKFKESFAWYSKNPEKLKLVYEAAIVELSKIEVEINTRKKVKAETIKDDANFTDTTIVMPVDSLKK